MVTFTREQIAEVKHIFGNAFACMDPAMRCDREGGPSQACINFEARARRSFADLDALLQPEEDERTL